MENANNLPTAKENWDEFVGAVREQIKAPLEVNQLYCIRGPEEFCILGNLVQRWSYTDEEVFQAIKNLFLPILRRNYPDVEFHATIEFSDLPVYGEKYKWRGFFFWSESGMREFYDNVLKERFPPREYPFMAWEEVKIWKEYWKNGGIFTTPGQQEDFIKEANRCRRERIARGIKVKELIKMLSAFDPEKKVSIRGTWFEYYRGTLFGAGAGYKERAANFNIASVKTRRDGSAIIQAEAPHPEDD